MLIELACIYQRYLFKEDGECSRKGRRISFYFESPFSLYHLNPSLKRQRSPGSALLWCFLLYCFSDPRTGQWNWSCAVSSTSTKMKGIYKYISNIFVVKDREMEIGLPTDVKHVAHIGWDGPSGSAPNWMNEFKAAPDFTATSVGNSASALSTWSSQDYGESVGHQSTSEAYKSMPQTELPSIPKPKQKRKKNKPSTSSPRSTSSTSRSSRAAKSKAKFVEGNPKPTNIEVA